MATQTRRLSVAAIKRLQETVEAEQVCGSSQIATDLDTLLRWHDEQPARDAAIRVEERAACELAVYRQKDKFLNMPTAVNAAIDDCAEAIRARASSATQPEPAIKAVFREMHIVDSWSGSENHKLARRYITAVLDNLPRAEMIEALQEAFDNGADDPEAWDAAIAAARATLLPGNAA